MAENPRIEELRRRLDKEPGSRLFAQLAEELRKDGDLDGAIRVARGGLATHPNYPSARMTLGRALYDSGDLLAARAEFEIVLRGAPDNILANRYLAECLEAMGDLGSALLQYRAVHAMAPGDRQIEAQIRSLEQKLAPPRAERSIPPVAAPPPSARPAVARPPMPRVEPPPAAAPAAPSPVAVPPARPAPAAEPPAPSGRAAVTFLDEGFEWEAAPDEGARLHPPQSPAPRAPELEATLADAQEASPVARVVAARPPVAEAPPPGPPVPPVRAPEPPPPAARGSSAGSSPSAPSPPVGAAPPVAGEAADLASPTLAELYFQQGFVEKAREVYRQLLQREPENERARGRLAELSAMRSGSGAVASAPPAAPPDPAEETRAERRRALEQAIARLEELLDTVRRHEPAGGTR